MASTMGNQARSSSAGAIRRCAGFSLVEVLVTLVVGAVLMAVVVPSMSELLSAQKCISLSSTFFHSMHLARSEAIKRNARTVMCKSAAGTSCTSTGGWHQGWIVFHDINNNAALDAGEAVVQHQGAAGADVRLTGNLPVANYISFSAMGTAKLTSGAFQAGTLTLCPPPSSNAGVRQIILSGTGRPRTERGSASDCT